MGVVRKGKSEKNLCAACHALRGRAAGCGIDAMGICGCAEWSVLCTILVLWGRVIGDWIRFLDQYRERWK